MATEVKRVLPLWPGEGKSAAADWSEVKDVLGHALSGVMDGEQQDTGETSDLGADTFAGELRYEDQMAALQRQINRLEAEKRERRSHTGTHVE